MKQFFSFILSLFLLGNCSVSKAEMDYLFLLLNKKDKKSQTVTNTSNEEYEVDPYSGFSSELQAVMSYKIDQDSIDPMISHLKKDTWKRLNDSAKSPIKIKLNTKITYGVTDGTATEEVGGYNLQKTGSEIFNPSLSAILNIKAQEKFAVVIAAVYDSGATPKADNLGQLLKQWKTLQSDIKDDSKTVDNILDTDSMAKIALGKNNAKKTDVAFTGKKTTLKTEGTNIFDKIKTKNKQAGKAKKKTKTNSSSSSIKKGYHNTGFIYFYYPKDRKIYYLNKESSGGMNIYKMDLDGQNSAKAFSTAIITAGGIHADARYLYIHNDTLYYSGKVDTTGLELSSMKLDGSSPNNYGVYAGMMRVFGNRLYTFQKNSTNYDLYSLDLSASGSSPTEEVSSCNCYVEAKKGGDFYVKGNNIYYHKGSNELYKKGLSSELSVGKYDNYVFAPNDIYYRYHSQQNGSNFINKYYIAKNDYTMSSSTHSPFKDRKEQLNGTNALNVSEDWMVYYGKGTDKGLYSVSIDGNTEKQLVKIPYESGVLPKIRGEIKIIGDWAYYMLGEIAKPKEYTIYRIKKDGTGEATVKTITLP